MKTGVSLNQIGTVARGKSRHRPRNDPSLYGGPYPFIQTGDITNSELYVSSYSQTYSERGLSQSKLWNPGVLCIVNAGVNTGDSAVLGIQACFPDSVISFTADPAKSDVRFVKYFLDSVKTGIRSITMGATQDNLSVSKLLTIKLPVYDLAIQRKIAGVLSTYDDLIENNRRRIAILENMAEEIYREWFVRMRFPGHQDAKFEKGVPVGWEVKPLSSIVDEVRDGVAKKDLADDELYVGLEHLPRRSFALREWTTASTVDSNKLRFAVGDILFGKIRPYLHKIVLSHVSGACSGDTIILRPIVDAMRGFVLLTVFSETFVELATIASKGTKMPRADWAFLSKLEIKIPSESLAAKFDEHFDTAYQEIVVLLQQNERLAKSRDALLTRLISGKVSVDELDIRLPPSMSENVERTMEEAVHA